MNKLLVRQLRRSFGSLEQVPKDLEKFLDAVNQTYDHHDQDRMLVERSLEISSEELETVNSELRSIFKQFPDIFFRLDANGQILDYLSRDQENIFNTEKGLVGRFIQNMPDQAIGNSFKAAMQLVNHNQKKVSFDYSMRIKKQNHSFEANLFPIFQNQIIVFIEDITSRIRAEKELSVAKEKAVQSDNLKSAFLANMSHEIRSPMNSILGFAELLEDDDLTPLERLKYTGIIKKSGNHLLNLISDIIDISKIEAGQLAINKTNCTINDLMCEIYELFLSKDKLKDKQLDLFCRHPLTNQESTIVTDPVRLKQILINLLGNSIKFTDSGYVEFGYSLVEVDMKKMIQFFVKDTGRGISKQGKKLVYKRFTHDNRDMAIVPEGTGLGLSISKELVELLGGEIWFTSKQDVGTQFYFTIPYKQPL